MDIAFKTQYNPNDWVWKEAFAGTLPAIYNSTNRAYEFDTSTQNQKDKYINAAKTMIIMNICYAAAAAEERLSQKQIDELRKKNIEELMADMAEWQIKATIFSRNLDTGSYFSQYREFKEKKAAAEKK